MKTVLVQVSIHHCVASCWSQRGSLECDLSERGLVRPDCLIETEYCNQGDLFLAQKYLKLERSKLVKVLKSC